MIKQSYTRALRSYDKDLFCDVNQDGVLCVFRKAKRYQLVWEDGFTIYELKEGKQYIFALTENWALSGRPIGWGIELVVNRIREIDTLANEQFFEKMDEANARADESKRRSVRNEMEGFWSHERKRFARTMDESVGCTHSMNKDEKRKRLKDRSIKNGNY